MWASYLIGGLVIFTLGLGFVAVMAMMFGKEDGRVVDVLMKIFGWCVIVLMFIAILGLIGLFVWVFFIEGV